MNKPDKIFYCKFCKAAMPDYKKGPRACKTCKAKGVLKLSDEEKKRRHEKSKKTTMLNHGVENISQLNSIKAKKSQTLQKNYGVNSPLQSKDILNKARNTTKERYGNIFFTKTVKYRRQVRKHNDIDPDIQPLYRYTWCRFCGANTPILKGEYEDYSVCDDCSDLGLVVKKHYDDKILQRRNERLKKTSLKKYGVENPLQSEIIREKIKKTNLEKYGVENPFQSEMIKNKIKKTNLEKYGVENPSSSDEIKEKKIATSIKNYGTEYPLQNPLVHQKHIENFAKNHDGAKHPYQVKEIRNKMIQAIKGNYAHKIINLLENKNINIHSDYSLDGGYYKKIDLKCTKCGLIFQNSIFHILSTRHGCPVCDPFIPINKYGFSISEREISDYIRNDLGIKHIINNTKQIITPRELDIYLPDYKIAIEYHGLYWHSTNFNEEIDKNAHRYKYEKCKELGIRLIQIFEDEWILNNEIVKSRLKHILNKSDNKKIYARQCIIKEISSTEKNEFLEKYHLQGKDNSVIKLGAFFAGELVSVMTFSHGNISKGSKNIENVWELNRFASSIDYTVVGIASKLLKHFERNYKWKEIFSYADLRWSVGGVYKNLGFDYICDTKINYFYTKGMVRIHRFNLRKRPDEPKDIPEWLLRQEEGYYRIWDAGHMKFHKQNI